MNVVSLVGVVRRGDLDLPGRPPVRTCSGFTSPGYLDATQPILMLGILFGLSMDYEVFLLSRIREEWDRTGDNTTAVATGLQRSGRIITSAAILLAVVIGGFATSGIVFLKMIGIGMLVAVIIDATAGPGAPGARRRCGCSATSTGGRRPAAALVGAARPARGRARPAAPTRRSSSPPRKDLRDATRGGDLGSPAARLATMSSQSRPEVAVIGGSGFYEFLTDAERDRGRDAVREPSAAIAVGEVGGSRRSPSCRDTDASTSSRRIGSTTGPTSGRCARSAYAGCSRRAPSAACSRSSDRARSSSPTSSSTGPRPGPDLLWTRAPRTCRFADPYCPALRRRSSLRRRRRRRRRHHGRHRGTALLHPRRVAVVRSPRLVAGQHDRPSRSRARPRAGAVLRPDRPGHRPDAGVDGADAR